MGKQGKQQRDHWLPQVSTRSDLIEGEAEGLVKRDSFPDVF